MKYYILQFEGEIQLISSNDLDHKELLDLQGCVIRCTGRYAILLDAVAMRLLRKYLVENFGLAATRPVFTQFGFTRGWRRMAAIG